MSKIERQFKKLLLNYLQNPQHTDKKDNLITAASALFDQVLTECDHEADEFIPIIYETIKPIVKEIKLNPASADMLEQLKQALGCSDKEVEHQAFHVLNMAYDLIYPPKNCLREIVNNMLEVQYKLEQEEITVSNKNLAGSLFISSADVNNIREKKLIIDTLTASITNAVFTRSNYDKNRQFFPATVELDQKKQHIDTHIDSLLEDDCKKILADFLLEVMPVLSSVRDNIDDTTQSHKRNPLKVHTFNDKWFFDFIAKLVQKIQEVLGVKTTEERCLDQAIEEVQKLDIYLK